MNWEIFFTVLSGMAIALSVIFGLAIGAAEIDHRLGSPWAGLSVIVFFVLIFSAVMAGL